MENTSVNTETNPEPQSKGPEGTVQTLPGFSFDAFWVEHGKKVLGIVAGLVIVAITVPIISNLRKTQAEAAALAFSKASTPEEFLQVAEKHGGKTVAVQALQAAADLKFRDHKYEEALAIYERIIRDYSDSPMAVDAHVGKAMALESQNKLSEAAALYEDIIRRNSGKPLLGQVRLALARTLELQNNPKRALETYDEVMGANKNTMWAGEAGFKRELLLSKHPELKQAPVQPQAPAAGTPAPATGIPQLQPPTMNSLPSENK